MSSSRNTFYGNKDKEKAYELPADYKDSVVVRQVTVKQENGGMYEVPNTARIQTYSKEMYQKMVDNNFFSESSMKAEVLHEPK